MDDVYCWSKFPDGYDIGTAPTKPSIKSGDTVIYYTNALPSTKPYPKDICMYRLNYVPPYRLKSVPLELCKFSNNSHPLSIN